MKKNSRVRDYIQYYFDIGQPSVSLFPLRKRGAWKFHRGMRDDSISSSIRYSCPLEIRSMKTTRRIDEHTWISIILVRGAIRYGDIEFHQARSFCGEYFALDFPTFYILPISGIRWHVGGGSWRKIEIFVWRPRSSTRRTVWPMSQKFTIKKFGFGKNSSFNS